MLSNLYKNIESGWGMGVGWELCRQTNVVPYAVRSFGVRAGNLGDAGAGAGVSSLDFSFSLGSEAACPRLIGFINTWAFWGPTLNGDIYKAPTFFALSARIGGGRCGSSAGGP